jgi:hypothetical protein
MDEQPSQPYPLLVVVGSRRAGRMNQLERLIRKWPQHVQRTLMVTNRTVAKPFDELWYRLLPKEEILKISFEDMLTHFIEGAWRYTLLKEDVAFARLQRKYPMVGMSPAGLELLYERPKQEVFTALVLTPADPDAFLASLIQEQGLSPSEAREETDRAIRLSTLPPSARGNTSIVPLPVHGTTEDDALVDRTVEALLPH